MILKLVIGAILVVLIAAGLFLGGRQRNMVAKIAVVLAVIAIGLPLLFVLHYTSIYDVLHGFVGNITTAFGLSSELGAAFAVLLVVPAALILGMVFSFSKDRRTLGLSLLTIGIASYWVMLWLGTRDHLVTAEGGQLRCYTISQDGVQFFDQEQVDPRTGERCQWIDQSNIRYIKAIDEKLRSGEPLKRVEFASLDEVQFFATGTTGAIPLVWYHRTSDGSYEFYDAPGVHPIFGTMLEPVTPAIAEEWVRAAGLPQTAPVDTREEEVPAASDNEVRSTQPLATSTSLVVPANGTARVPMQRACSADSRTDEQMNR